MNMQGCGINEGTAHNMIMFSIPGTNRMKNDEITDGLREETSQFLADMIF